MTNITTKDYLLWLIALIPYFGIRIVEYITIREITQKVMPFMMIGFINKVGSSIFDSVASGERRE